MIDDVLVVGGGPAGASCATALARAGVRVTLVDAARGPRGMELLSGRARRALLAPSGEVPAGVCGIEVTRIASLWGTDRVSDRHAITNPYGSALAVDRRAFDAALRAQAALAGAVLLPRTVVTSVARDSSTWRVTMRGPEGSSERRATSLVIATGRAPDRLLDRAAEASAPEELALLGAVSPTVAARDPALYIESSEDGWWYSLPTHGASRYVGWCSTATRIRAAGVPPRERLARELELTRIVCGAGRPVVSGVYGRRAGSLRWSTCSGPGWLSIGDAAFAPDPLSGTGIEAALQSAAEAARVLLAGTDDGDRYEQWQRQQWRDHTAARARMRAMANLP